MSLPRAPSGDAFVGVQGGISGDGPLGRIEIDGKFFKENGRRFEFRGVTYGTFAPRASDGARFPERQQMKRDFAAMGEAGFTVVRTYTEPPDDLLDLAADWGLHVLAAVHWEDWRYLLGASRRAAARTARQGRAEVRAAARRLAGDERVLAINLGNEVPADVVRWYGTRTISAAIADLVETVKEEDGDHLVTYANYPTAEYLPLECLDFLTFNVFLEQRAEFRRYLTRLQHLAGDRPLVLGEVGLDAGRSPEGEVHQAAVLDWQLQTALDRGVAGTCVFSWTDEWWVGGSEVDGWNFGLVRADRSPKPALDVAARWNRCTVRDLDWPWPSISVVICAYNAATTLDECLRHTCDLHYPHLEILVVDDGSTDDTAAIVRRHPRARLVELPHAGLSVARNEGFRQATGELIAYLDSDAYPSPEWPYYLALALDGSSIGSVGGPNVPPPEDPIGAHVVAQAPGGPVHVLTADDRAEHVPGCNMAFWKKVLIEVGGFDPVYTSAGDDVDLCWKVLDRGWEIGFHPAALVWHHRRSGLRPYLRQQRGYGRAEALVEARHPDRFGPLGTARWRGRIYTSLPQARWGQRVYRGQFGTAAYQSVYQQGGYALDVAHQAGVPAATALLATAPLAAVAVQLALPALLAALYLLSIVAIDMVRAHPPRGSGLARARFRSSVAAHHLLQPCVRTWGRWRGAGAAHRGLPAVAPLPRAVRTAAGGVHVLKEDRAREALASTLVEELRRKGLRLLPAIGWEDHDARLVSTFLFADLQTSSHPVGFVQVRVRTRPRWARLALTALTTASVFAVNALAAAVVTVAVTAALCRSAWRPRRILERAVQRPPVKA